MDNQEVKQEYRVVQGWGADTPGVLVGGIYDSLATAQLVADQFDDTSIETRELGPWHTRPQAPELPETITLVSNLDYVTNRYLPWALASEHRHYPEDSIFQQIDVDLGSVAYS